MRNKFGLFTFIFVFFVSAAAAVVYENNGVTVQQAVISGNNVRIKGSGAPPYSNVEWEGHVVTQVDEKGQFNFVTDEIPSGCVGKVGVEAINTTVFVLLNNCNVATYGFYSAPQVLATVRPGETATLASECDAGDYSINAGIVVYDAKYVTRFSGPVNQSWAVQITNIDDTNDADFRVAAICADFLVPHGLNMNSN